MCLYGRHGGSLLLAHGALVAHMGRSSPTNFVISIDGEEHPIQLNNPIVLQMGNRERRIVLRSAP